MLRALLVILVLLGSGCLSSGGDHGDYVEGTDPVLPNGEPLLDWATLQGNNLGWGYHPDAGVPYCKASTPDNWDECVGAEWKVVGINTGDHGAAKSSAVLYDGTIYLGADTGMVHAFTPNGTELWRHAVEPSRNGIHSTPTVAGDQLFIGGYDGAMYAIDRHNGERLWRTQVGSWIGSSPRLHDGHIYIAVEHGGSTKVDGVASTAPWGDVQILDAWTGEVLWRSQRLGSHPHSTVAISPEDNVFVVGANDDRVYAWDLNDREARWSFHAARGDEGDVKGAILIFDGAAFFGSWDHHYYRVDLATGAQDWSIQTGAWAMTGSAVDPTTGTVYFGSHDRHVYAADAATGEVLWKQRLGAHLVGSPTLANGMLLFGASDYHLHAFDKDSGERLWSYPTKHRVSAAPLIVGDRIVFADRSECGPIEDGVCAWGGTHGILYSLAPPQE